jgi:hypothetical protein
VNNGSDPDSAVAVRAAEWIRRKQRADIDYRQLADGFPLTQEGARRGAQILAPLGEPLAIECVDKRSDEFGITTYRFHVTFESGKIRFDFGLFADGKINQLSFSPLPGEHSPLNRLIPDI